MSIMNKLKQRSKIQTSAPLSTSTYFYSDLTPTSVPMLNVALSGDLEGGLAPGLTVIAGPSKHFKTSFALMIATSYLKERPESALVFFDSEFGAPKGYFDTFGIDQERVFHVPVTNIEELKFELVNQLEEFEDDDDVIIVVDSFGNLASKKELEDALNEKSVADMTRAKALKGLFRMVTPYLKTKKIPLLAINHTYKEIGLFPRDVVSGGTGIYYSADTIWIVGRSQNKKVQDVVGYDFGIRVEKSRYVKENSRIPITVSWEGGVGEYSGLLDVAVAAGFVSKSGAWYDNNYGCRKQGKEGTQCWEFFDPILKNPEFVNWVRKQYQIGNADLLSPDEIVDMEGDV